MKKLVFAVVIGGLVTFAACSKSSSGGVGTYTCKCNTVVGGVSTPSTSTFSNVTQAEAQTSCSQAGTLLATQYPGSSCALQ
jgi:hypothetical protein